MALRLSEGLGRIGAVTKARMIDGKDVMKALPRRGGLAPGGAAFLPPPLPMLSEGQALPMAAGSTN